MFLQKIELLKGALTTRNGTTRFAKLPIEGSSEKVNKIKSKEKMNETVMVSNQLYLQNINGI
jgi:hypothetical protein